MTRLLMIILTAAALAGCAGALGGGSSYRVEVTDPATGRVFRATADTLQSTESMTLNFQGNPLTGEVTGLTFSKTGTQNGAYSNAVMEKLVDKIPAAK